MNENTIKEHAYQHDASENKPTHIHIHNSPQTTTAQIVIPPPRSTVTTGMLCLFLGIFGIHRFYVGKTGTGIAILLLTLFGLGIGWIWSIIDCIMICSGHFKDNWERPLEGSAKPVIITWIVGGVILIGLGAILLLLILGAAANAH